MTNKNKTAISNADLNWYVQSIILQRIQKKAGFKGNLMAIVGAVVLVLGGLTIQQASQESNIPEEEIQTALSDTNTVEQARSIMQEDSVSAQEDSVSAQEDSVSAQEDSVSAQELVDAILVHEGLIPKQTPFRYTNDKMRQWNTIHGFEIDKTSTRPNNRRNFIFLKNQEDVSKAVRQQFKNYASNPSRYGWDHEPTVQEALEKFDQSGVQGKISFLKKKYPYLDLTVSLSSIF